MIKKILSHWYLIPWALLIYFFVSVGNEMDDGKEYIDRCERSCLDKGFPSFATNFTQPVSCYCKTRFKVITNKDVDWDYVEWNNDD